MRILLLCLIISLSVNLSVHAERKIAADTSIEDYRPIGELRVWTFIAKDSTLGQLYSTVKERVTIDGTPGLLIKEKLDLDWSKIGGQHSVIETEHFVSLDGRYLGDKMRITVNDQTTRLEFEREDGQLEGFYTRGDREIEETRPFDTNLFAITNNFLDQYEFFFAMRDIAEGDLIDGTVYSAQDMLLTSIQGSVEGFDLRRLYNQVVDSAFAIRLTRPQQVLLYFTPDKRLVKAEFPQQKLKVYLDVVRQAATPEKSTQALSLFYYLRLIPFFFVYFLIGAGAIALFIGSSYRRPPVYMAFVLGGVGYALLSTIQLPIQMYLVSEVLIPNIEQGGSTWLWAAMPAGAVGLMQEIFKFGMIWFVAGRQWGLTIKLPIVGLMIGAGFGVFEACTLASQSVMTTDLVSVYQLERISLIVFHVCSGSLIGFALSANTKKAALMLISMLTINSAWRYLPVFVQQGVFPVEVMHLVVSFVVVGLVIGALLVSRQTPRESKPT